MTSVRLEGAPTWTWKALIALATLGLALIKLGTGGAKSAYVQARAVVQGPPLETTDYTTLYLERSETMKTVTLQLEVDCPTKWIRVVPPVDVRIDVEPDTGFDFIPLNGKTIRVSPGTREYNSWGERMGRPFKLQGTTLGQKVTFVLSRQ